MTYINADVKITAHAAIKQNIHGVGANDIADVADISTHASVTTNVHGTGAGNDVVGDDEVYSTLSSLLETSFADYGVTIKKLTDNSGVDILYASDAEDSTTENSFTLKKTVSLPINTPASLKISFDLKISSSDGTSAGRIYRNGSPVGAERVNGTESYVTYIEEVGGWSAGDELQIYIRDYDSYTASVRNFRILGTVVETSYQFE